MPEFSHTPQCNLPIDEVPEQVVKLLRLLIDGFGDVYTSTAVFYKE